MRCAVILFATILLAADEPRADRMPVPDAAAQAKAEKTIKDVFKTEYTKKKAADQIELADKLLKQAEETTDDPASRYVLLREARDLAAKAADAALASKAVEEMAKVYAVPLLKAKLEMLELLDKSVVTVAAATPVFEIAMTAGEEAVAADDYDAAARFLKVAASAGRTMKNAANVGVASTRFKEIERLKIEFDKLKTDFETLKTSPSDVDACDRVGRFLCLFKGDWSAGLQLVVKGKDEKLVALAKKDLANPEAANARVEMADAWNEYALSVDKGLQYELLARARHWYKESVSDLTGLNKTRVEKRIAELDNLVASRNPTVAANIGWTILFRSNNPTNWDKDVNNGINNRAIKLGNAPDKTRYLKMTDCSRNSSVIIEITKNDLAKCVDTKGYGWNGTNKYEWKAYQLGIYDPAWGTLNKGDITLRTSPNARGWGFGIRHRLDDRTGYSWAGKEIAATVFEISVKTGDLTAEETKLLLNRKGK